MAFSFDELKFARDRGYSDDEIWNIISSENKEIGLAKERGYSLDEVASIESGQPMPSVEVPEPEPIEERGIARAAGDVGVAFTQGGVRGFRSLTDLFGAGNPASTTLRGVEDYVGNLLSAQAKKDQWEVSRILIEAQDKGIYDQLIAGVEAFATAPVLTTAGAAGSIAVNLLGGITANAASLGIRGIALGARGMMASQAAIGAAQGAGIIKGEIYDATEKYLLEQGMSPEIAKQGASEAQSFGGKNLDSILLGTGLGAAAAMTGVEKVARNFILRQGGIPTTKAITRFVTGTLEEMVPEAAQGGQEQLAKNLALQREGADVPTMRGVVGSAALEGLAGGALGGPTKLLFGKSKGKTPEIIEEEEIDSTSDQVADELEKEPVSPATEMAMKRMQFQSQIDNLTTEIEEDELLLQTIEQTSPDRQRAELALSGKKTALANIISEFNTIPKEELSETITPATATKETTIARIDELNKEFDALDENDQVGIDRLNKQIFAEQNKLAGLTAIEQGIDPQGTTPTREMGLPPSGRRSEFGTFFPDRPVLQAFVKATDKVLGAITVTSKRAQKLKNAIRTGIANNAGFLAGTNTEVISSEEYGKLTGGKQVAADTGTYRATFFNGKKYLVVPDVNQLAGISIEGEQRAANRDAALDQEARAASKKLEEEVIHLSMFQGIQDEYKNIKKPKFSEQEYIVKRISDIAKEVKRTNPNALPGVSEVYLNQKNRLLDDMTFSQEFMRMVIQRVRTGQITEDLNAIRKAEQEAFSDQDKGLITAWKNSILNALEFVRNGIARYLGKGTSTKEVKRMEDAINNILDEYGIVKGEANYEFKDYSAAKPRVQVTNIDSIINQGGGTVAVQENGRDVNFKQFGIVIDGDSAEVVFVELDPSEYGRGIGLEAYRYLGNELASRGITLRSSGAQYGPGKNLWLKLAQQGNARLNGVRRFEFVQATPVTPAQSINEPLSFTDIEFNDNPEYDSNTGKTTRSSGIAQIVSMADRQIALVNINGVAVPFYLSTGKAGKKNVAAGKWYPILGLDVDGWINKGSQQEISSYYGSPVLKSIAERLDSQLGTTTPARKVSSKAVVDSINKGIASIGIVPVSNGTSTTEQSISDNAKRLVDFVEGSNKQQATPVTPRPLPTDVLPTETPAVTEAPAAEVPAITPAPVSETPAATQVEMPIADRIVQGEPKDKSKIYGGQAQTITFTDPQTEGRITIVDRRDGSPASVFELYVPEEFRQKGIGSALQKKAQEAFPTLQGQVSSKVAARSAYKLGRRPQGNPNATLDEVFDLIDKKSSVNMVTSAAQVPAVTEAPAAEVAAVTPTKEVRNIEEEAGEPTGGIEARASYYQNFEVFDKNGENRREEQIVVEADTPAQAEQLIRNTPKYQGLAQRNKAKKIRLFPMGQVERYRLPGEFPIIARAGVTPTNADPLGNVRDQFGPRASGHINDNTPEERILGESQALQRGYPEEFATISAKKTILGELSKTATGLRQTLWEHLGDLYHRAGSTTDYGSMVEKVNKFIRWSKNPKEFENQLKSNAIYQATVEKYGNNYTAEAFKEVNESAEGRKAIEDASRKIRYMDVAFASMYEKLQAFTPLQAMGRNMAIAFGLRRYDVAEQLGKSILSAIESRGDSVVKYGFNYEGVNNLSRSNNQTKQQFDSITKAAEIVKNDPLRSIEFFKQVSDRITDEELLAPIAMMEGQPIEARAGVTPEGEPISKRGQSIMQKITTRMIADLEAQVEMLKPKKNKAYTEYKSRTTKKGKTYNQALISPFSLAANLFTSNSFTEANNALNKIVRGNPDADFFDIAQGLAGTDAAEAQRRYGIDQNERFVLMDMIYSLLPAFRKEVDDSGMKATARDSFRLDALNVEAKLAQNIALAAQSGGQIVGYARVLRKLVGAGMAILTYKRGIIDSMGSLAKATNTSFNDVANAIKGDRRKSMDKVFNTKEVFKKAVSMIKMAQRNPEKVRQAIRAEVSKRQNLKTTDILLQFASGLFDTKEDKYANMVLDQTVQNILSIGMNKKEFSIDNVTKFMYQSFATAAKQLGIEQAGVEKPKRGKRSGKYMEMVKAVIGNDNAYKSFVNDLASRMAEKYQSRDAFNADFAELFTALRSNEWADGLREQAIKDTAQFLNYKFADLFTYLGSQRNVNQEAVKQHIRAELQGTGASNELIEKFIQDTDKYLNEETSRILQDKLGFRIDEKTGKVIPKPLLSSKIKEEAEEQFKAIKNLKDISKLSTSDEGNFIEALISRIITEVGMDKEQATELATLISTQMEKAMLAQRSENVDRAIKDAQEILNSNGVKPKTNQRTVLQKLIEMANMGVLDAEGVYEAFRKTHDFPKGFLPYDADFTNTLREWGDRISKLPPGVIRSIEEEKMGRALMEKSKFTTGDILSSYWYFSLLSQVATQGINALSGASNLMANVAVWSLYKPKSFFPMMRAMYHAIDGRKSPAVNSFLYVMRNGLNPSGMQDEKRAKYPKTNVLESATPENTPKIVYYLTNFGDGKINFLPDWMNTALKNVNPRQLMRVLRATDMFLREVAYEAKAAQIGAADFSREGFDMAKRQAESELFSSDATGKQKEQEIIIRANEIYREQRLDETGRAIAEQASLETAFNQQPVGLFGLLANFVNSLLGKYPATKFVIPFTNVVANVTNEFINYTPVFSQIRLIGSKRRGVNDPFTQGSAEKQMEMQIKGFIGLAAMAVPFIIQALTGGDEEDQEERPYIQFYAEGPKDPRQKKIWQQRGGQKYSVRVGNTYFSYLPTPLVIPLAMGAMLQEEIKSMNKKGEKIQSEDIGKLAASVLTAPFSVGFVAVLNQSFLTGLADLLEFKESQNPVEKGTQVVGGILSRMAVPGVFRDINKLYTEDKAIGGDYLSNFLKDFPGSVNFLNKDVNYFGDDAKFPSAVREEGFGRRLASVVGRIVSTEQPDPAFEVMYRNNLTPPSWDASLSWDNGKRMTKEQELQFIREAGPLMRERIVEVSDELDELPIDEAQDLLSTEIRIIRREVKEDLQDRLEIPLDIQ